MKNLRNAVVYVGEIKNNAPPPNVAAETKNAKRKLYGDKIITSEKLISQLKVFVGFGDQSR